MLPYGTALSSGLKFLNMTWTSDHRGCSQAETAEMTAGAKNIFIFLWQDFKKTMSTSMWPNFVKKPNLRKNDNIIRKKLWLLIHRNQGLKKQANLKMKDYFFNQIMKLWVLNSNFILDLEMSPHFQEPLFWTVPDRTRGSQLAKNLRGKC